MSSPSSDTIEFACSACNKSLRVPSSAAGKKAKCPDCGSVQVIPDSSAAKYAAAEEKFSMPTGSVNTPPPARSEKPSGPALSPTQVGAFRSTIEGHHAEEGSDTRTRQLFKKITREVSKIYVGQDELVLGTLTALFSSGHVLIESAPGLGKTLFVRTLGRVLGCQFGRVQFTADLMPSDITGAPIFDMKTNEFRFRPGPIFTQLLLADEINRSPAKTHAALLEIMQEFRVTVDGTSHKIERPFLVLATQNPIESEGTYNLPEAQLDRFMFKLRLNYPAIDEEAEILRMHSRQEDINRRLEEELAVVTSPEEILEITQLNSDVIVDDKLIDYINKIVRLTREWPQFHMGASPRAGITLMQGARTLAAFSGRNYAVPDDVVQIAIPTLRHRVILSAEAEVEGHDVDDLLTELIRTVEVPRL
ncbi:AAA family ATPase [Blastopirellula sp. JC732]|uniref:AAA family ATPase n=1 Tax=Blastopirellula sediminis TaxID=2894196 RepID=A0A9X1MKJ7_9BACT|nr:AAA family ATPase [Blastopirellula sediminis]MCC9609293.1 AAA family ATPase [Blastopirellula sediminis]MCC9627930.1 AAA family ATPase [Blastopirellula sediminis]